MSNEEFENYVTLIGKLLQLKRSERDLIASELRDHLQLRVADLTAGGISKKDAVNQALDEFGDATVMARNFETILKLKRRRNVMRFTTFSIVGVFLAAVLTMAMWPEGARFGAPDKTVAQENQGEQKEQGIASKPDDPVVGLKTDSLSEATRRVLIAEEILKNPVDIDFDEIPAEDVLDFLSERTNLNFLLTSSCRNDSFTEDELVTFKVSGMPLGKSLQLMLREFNATYSIDEGAILIFSLDEPELFQRVKMFDCSELLRAIPAIENLKPAGQGAPGMGVNAPQGQQDGTKAAGSFGGGVFMVVDQESQTQTEEAPQVAASPTMPAVPVVTRSVNTTSPEQRLIDLLMEMVEPDSWQDNGGFGTVQIVSGIVVVRQNEAVLRDIENLLNDLSVRVLGKKLAKDSVNSQPARTTLPKLEKSSESEPTSSDENDPFGGKAKDDDPFADSDAESPFG